MPPEEHGLPFDRPAPARAYAWMLGSKDTYEIDRRSVLGMATQFPECVDMSRTNRQYLYRVVRHLVQEEGIRQILDMGCGLPSNDNVHEVAHRFAPDTRVVYVDVDPIVLAHGRALLADDETTAVVRADMRDQETILAHPDVTRLIDFDQPLAVLFIAVLHHITDADDPRAVLRTAIDRAAPGSFLALSHAVSDEPEYGAAFSANLRAQGVPWQTRTPAEVAAFTHGLQPVRPGLGRVESWRPDPFQPKLNPVAPELEPYLGSSKLNNRLYEYGGLLRKP